MEYIYGALLIHRCGGRIDVPTVTKVMQDAGAKPDEGKVKALVAAMEGVDIEKAIKEAAMITAAPATAIESGEEKEERKVEPKEDPDKAAAGLGALFG